MTPGIFDLNINQGASFKFAAAFNNPSGQPLFNFAGYTFLGQIRSYAGAPNPVVATFTIAPTIAVASSLDISLTNTQTAAIPAPTSTANPTGTTQYFYDIDVIDGSGFVTRVLQGSVFVSPSVSRP